VLTIPPKWQRLINASSIEVVPRFDDPVPAEAIEALTELPEFRRAYEPDGLSVGEFDEFGATVRTLRQFTASYQELVATVRDVILPSPG
jgi:transaldolase